MQADLAMQMMADLMWTALRVAAPLLVLIVLVGLLIGVLQVVTQVQEMSLSFVPKLFVAAVTIVLIGPWMMRKIANYALRLWSSIPTML